QRGHHQAAAHYFLRVGQADFHRKFAAIFAARSKIEPDSHRPAARRAKEVLAMAAVLSARRLGHQELDRLPDKLVARVREHPLASGVKIDDAPLAIDDD